FSGDGRWLAPARRGKQDQLLEVTPSREYRTLVSASGAGEESYGLGDISPDGRLLVVGMDDGARLWDLDSGREVAKLPPQTIYAAFEGGGGGAARPPGRAPDGRRGRPAALADHQGRSGGEASAPRPAAATVRPAPRLVRALPGGAH